MVFGIVLGIVSFVVMAWFVNLLAAFLTLLAIGFYVVVYTMLLKRTTQTSSSAAPPVPCHRSSAGPRSPGRRRPGPHPLRPGLLLDPAALLGAVAAIRKDYARRRRPDALPSSGILETTRQIALYTLLMVAISLILWPVAKMGPIYLARPSASGPCSWQAYALWRRGNSEEGSTQGAIALYRYSISYLSLLFLAIAVDAVAVTV